MINDGAGMTMRSEQKRIERMHIEVARNLIKDFPEGEIQACNPDPPDLQIVTSNGVAFAVEHTQIFRPPDSKGIRLQAQENERRIIVNQAREQYEKRNSIPLWVSVDFREVCGLDRKIDIALKKQKRQPLAQKIAKIVMSNIPAKGETIIMPKLFSRLDEWPQEIDEIFIWRYEKLQSSHWSVDEGASTPPVTPELIQGRIAAKEKKIPAYQAKYDQKWLLIVEEGSRSSNDFDHDLSVLTFQNRYRTIFDRVFFLRFLHGQIREVKLACKDL